MCNRARRRERKESFRSRGRLRNRILARLESQRESSRRPMIEKKKTDFISHLQFIINSVLYTSSSFSLSLPFSLSLSFFLFFCLRIQTKYNRGSTKLRSTEIEFNETPFSLFSCMSRVDSRVSRVV